MSKSSSSSTSASDSAPIPASQASAPSHAAGSEPPGGKRAVVLCGGGITGAMYELGALAAMDDYLDATSQPRPGGSGLSSTSFDIYVGISAGSFVATMLCAGISPRRLARAVLGDPADRYLVPHQRTDLFKFEPLRATRIGLTLGGVALRSLYRVLSGRISPGDIPSELLAATPGGVLSLKPYARFLR
ncbi:MAG: patatin-like phospholipase family protein, partial [Deltaproteobacteria bacterium]|nr:patatin-like phospholipase family protein [Deltaproteobacteria bacterium]